MKKLLVLILCLLLTGSVFADGIGGGGIGDDGIGGDGVGDDEIATSSCGGGYTALTGSDTNVMLDSTGGSICCPN
jgi:hypothetical protein